MKALITCGPTWVAIDPVRVISNQSTGQMGHGIARALAQKGWDVTLLQGQVTDNTDLTGVRVIKFTYFDELEKALKKECKKKYDVIIHAAAVADYRLENRHNKKISSEKKELSLRLVPLPKLINQIKQLAKDSFLVGFKLETALKRTDIPERTRKLFIEAQCDLVVANVNNTEGYKGYLIDADGNILSHQTSKAKMIKDLVGVLL